MRARLLLLLVLCCAAGPRLLAEPPPIKPMEMTSLNEVGGKTLKDWIKETKHADAGEREKAVRAIMCFGRDAAEPAGAALIDRLGDRDSSVRTNAVIAIGTIGVGKSDVPRAVDSLGVRVADDPQAIVRYHAACAISRFGTQGRAAVPKLLRAIQDASAFEIRKSAVYALGIVAYDAQGADMKVVEALVKCLDDTAAEVRMESVVAIIGLGKPALPADVLRLDAYIRRRLPIEIRAGDKLVVIWLHMALMKLHEVQDPELKAVAKFLKDKEATVREQAAAALGMLGKEARPMIPDLIEVLQDKVPEVVLSAAIALVNTGSRTDRLVEALTEVRDRKDSSEAMKKAMDQLLGTLKGKAEK